MEYREKTNLIEKDLDFSNFNNIDISNLLEISYIFGKNNYRLNELNNIIMNFGNDGINTYATFIKYVYEKCITNKLNYLELQEEETENLVNEFINKYFEKK